MASVRNTRTYNYDKQINPRQRAVRFLQDNRDTFIDYPENNIPRIDREDVELMDYYMGPFSQYCFYGGFGLAVAMTGLSVWVIKGTKGLKAKYLGLFVLPLLPMFGSTFVHYQVTGRFLDYCISKYEDRGLWDTDLWEYHKQRRGTNELSSEWTIGSKS